MPSEVDVNDLGTVSPEEFVWALREVSVELESGGALGIIGANGAGKSTLLKILAQVTAPTLGEVRIKGRVSSLLEVGTGFHPELTGRENVYLSGAIHGLSRRDVSRRFDDIVEFAGVERYIDTPVKRYSSGMFVRLGFSVAAHLEPDVMVIDEVLAVGDVNFQRHCVDRLSAATREGRTILFVSHNMALVERLCSRGLLLEKGRVVCDGAIADVVHQYLRQAVSERSGFVDLRRVARAVPSTAAIMGLGVRVADDPEYRSFVSTGDTVTVDVHYDLGDRSADGVVIGIDSLMAQRVMTVVTESRLDTQEPVTGTGVLCCDVPAFPLAEGEYSLTIELWNKRSFSVIDAVHGAMRLHVRSPGISFAATGGFIQQTAQWRTVRSSAQSRAIGQ